MGDPDAKYGKSSADYLVDYAFLVDYMIQILFIEEKLTTAVDDAGAALSMLVEDEIYEGKAREEMTTFFWSYQTHLSKLLGFFMYARNFLQKVIEQTIHTDDQLVALVIQAGQRHTSATAPAA